MPLLQNDSFVSDWPASYESQQKYLITKVSTLIDFFLFISEVCGIAE